MFHKSKSSTACRKLEARLEDYLGGSSDSELQQHLAQCAACRLALENSRLAGDLLRQAAEPLGEPRPAFLAGVMAKIREEKARAESLAAFWRPLEFLASRLALTAAVLLLALSTYLVEFAPGRNMAQVPGRTELSASDFPQPPRDPVSNEEVLQSLAERDNGR
jgi:predicted anti-sigma-YlaC factor YlaD